MKRIIFLFLVILAITGCKKDEQLVITGKITFDFVTEAADYYIYLDNDQDLSNGYTARIIQSAGFSVTQMDFVIKTDNVPEGNYYLRGGYDTESADNMNPVDPSVWEGQGWYGSNSSTPPSAPSVNNLTGNYDFVIYALGK